MTIDTRGRQHYLREEIKRISKVTLRGNFTNEVDRDYWVARLKTLNGELMALDEIGKANRTATSQDRPSVSKTERVATQEPPHE